MLGLINGGMAALGLPSIERMVNDILDNPNNYSTRLIGLNYKGKNRTFKKRTLKKRILYKKLELDEFKILMSTRSRWK